MISETYSHATTTIYDFINTNQVSLMQRALRGAVIVLIIGSYS